MGSVQHPVPHTPFHFSSKPLTGLVMNVMEG